jgi:hypothetical protein
MLSITVWRSINAVRKNCNDDTIREDQLVVVFPPHPVQIHDCQVFLPHLIQFHDCQVYSAGISSKISSKKDSHHP